MLGRVSFQSYEPRFLKSPLSKNDKAQKTTSKDPPNKVTINKTYLDEAIKALLPSFFRLITEIQTNDGLLTSVAKSIRAFQNILKANTESAPAKFKHIRFPELDDCEQVDTDDMKMSLLSLLETLQYGTFDNIFEAWRCIRGEPILPHNFSCDDLKHELILFQFESNRKILVWPQPLDKYELSRIFDLPRNNFVNITSTNECFKITVQRDYAEYVVEPIVNDSTTTEAPPWSIPFVEFLKFVDRTKKWHHNIVDQYIINVIDKNYLGTGPFSFLIYSNWFLKDIGLITKTGDSDESSNGEGDNNSEASSRVSDGK